jgi:tetratricopeptide (TPR) repeat protein
MSAAGKERRDEDKRRKNRKSDVIIGKTSAKAGAKDFALNPQSTELEWVKHASAMEQQISRNTELGLDMLKMLRLEESVEAFDKVFLLKPNAYCWQAGIAKYYLGDLLGAAKIFAQSAAIYESKFGQLASEERIWRDACELKYLSALNRKQKEAMKGKGGIKEVMSQLAEPDPESDIPIEFRRVIRITKEMFEASTKEDSVNLALSRAKLRSICGTFDTKPTLDRKMWKLNSWYYLGLHYDAIGEEEESKECIKMALRLCPTSKGDDIVHTLPLLHMSKRDWFDDDEYEESDGSAAEVQTKSSGSLIKLPLGVTADPVIAKSLQDSISKMKFQELKTALKNRGLPHTGAKDELQSRLFNSLVDDVGFS